MRRNALLSVLALYHHDVTVFDGLQLPEAPTANPDVQYTIFFTPSKDDLVADILIETAELECLYPDPDTLKTVISFWSRKNKSIWQKLYDSCCLKYNPIWNVDGLVTVSRENTLTGSTEISDTDSKTGSKTSGTDTTENSTNARTGSETNVRTDDLQKDTSNTNTRSVSAYDSSGWSNESKTEEVGQEANTGTVQDVKTYNSVTDTYQMAGTSDTEEEWTESGTAGRTVDDTKSGTESESTRRTGNIGVTTTQSMIEEERAAAQFSFYDFIIRDFKKNFCLLIY